MSEMFLRLKAPFAPDQVSWRVGSTNSDKTRGMALAFIDARDVMDRLDEVVGPENWQNRYPPAEKKTVCEIDIWVEGRGWVTKSDGAGDTDVEAEKGALSDAFKRAAVRWGIGRYLYHLPSPWVELEQRGRTHVIKESEYAKLRALAAGDAPKAQPARPEKIAPANNAAPLSLDKRAGVLEDALRSCKTRLELKAAWDRGAKLCAELDQSLPERLQELTALHEMLEGTLPERSAA